MSIGGLGTYLCEEIAHELRNEIHAGPKGGMNDP
jgi:hypothetical protein